MEGISTLQIIIGNIVGALCGIFCIMSTFGKDKRKIIKLQCFDCFFGILSCLILHGFSGAVTQTINLMRNIFVYKEKLSNKMQVLFIILVIWVSLAFNNRGILGILPIIACVEYTIIIMKTKDPSIIKAGLAINNILWFLYDFIIMNYFSCIFSAAIIVFSITNIVRNKILHKNHLIK